MHTEESIEQSLAKAIRDIKDFPKPGVIFKDITPILKDPKLCKRVLDSFLQFCEGKQIDVVVGLEARGFLFGFMLAQQLNVPFVPIRKQGKLPYATRSKTYQLEYGEATIEMHEDAFEPGAKVLIHDDLLATGGTVAAASELIEEMGGEVVGFTFLVDLAFLGGINRIDSSEVPVCALLRIS